MLRTVVWTTVGVACGAVLAGCGSDGGGLPSAVAVEAADSVPSDTAAVSAPATDTTQAAAAPAPTTTTEGSTSTATSTATSTTPTSTTTPTAPPTGPGDLPTFCDAWRWIKGGGGVDQEAYRAAGEGRGEDDPPTPAQVRLAFDAVRPAFEPARTSAPPEVAEAAAATVDIYEAAGAALERHGYDLEAWEASEDPVDEEADRAFSRLSRFPRDPSEPDIVLADFLNAQCGMDLPDLSNRSSVGSMVPPEERQP
jgi:hypothetical protein